MRPSLLATISLAWASSAWAQPTTVVYQGFLVDAAGDPINAPVTLSFSLYDTDTDGTPLWTEEIADVPMEAGLFTVVLGETEPLDEDLFIMGEGEARWLGVAVGDSSQELSPRQPLGAVPWALVCGDAQTVAGLGPESLGDITGVEAGDGLTGGGTEGDVTLDVTFGGAGTATTVARSDHDHDAEYVNEGQADAIDSAMVQDGTVMFSDWASNGCSQDQIPKWNGTAWACASDQGGTTAGDIDAVIAGDGLSGGATSGDATLSIALNGVTSAMIQDGAVAFQDWASNGCAGGDVPKWDDISGTWNCALDDNTDSGGDVTAVFAGSGLLGGGTDGDVTLAADFSVFGACLPNNVVTGVDALTGGVICSADSDSGGTVTSVDTGTGLTGGPITTGGTISIAAGGVTSNEILDATITTDDLNSGIYAGTGSAATLARSDHTHDALRSSYGDAIVKSLWVGLVFSGDGFDYHLSEFSDGTNWAVLENATPASSTTIRLTAVGTNVCYISYRNGSRSNGTITSGNSNDFAVADDDDLRLIYTPCFNNLSTTRVDLHMVNNQWGAGFILDYPG